MKLSGFGNFVVRKKNSRKGRNPKTGQEIEITPRKVVSFRPSMIFKEHVIESPTAQPSKLFYRIGEVSRLTGLEPYVLRYWETEFPQLKPDKGRSGTAAL